MERLMIGAALVALAAAAEASPPQDHVIETGCRRSRRRSATPGRWCSGWSTAWMPMRRRRSGRPARCRRRAPARGAPWRHCNRAQRRFEPEQPALARDERAGAPADRGEALAQAVLRLRGPERSHGSLPRRSRHSPCRSARARTARRASPRFPSGTGTHSPDPSARSSQAGPRSCSRNTSVGLAPTPHAAPPMPLERQDGETFSLTCRVGKRGYVCSTLPRASFCFDFARGLFEMPGRRGALKRLSWLPSRRWSRARSDGLGAAPPSGRTRQRARTSAPPAALLRP